MKVYVCALAKNEHLYINEWVKYYVGLGIDHIYLYDNDNLNSQFIGNYIDKDYLDKVISPDDFESGDEVSLDY